MRWGSKSITSGSVKVLWPASVAACAKERSCDSSLPSRASASRASAKAVSTYTHSLEYWPSPSAIAYDKTSVALLLLA